MGKVEKMKHWEEYKNFKFKIEMARPSESEIVSYRDLVKLTIGYATL